MHSEKGLPWLNMSANESRDQLQDYVFNRIGALVLNYLSLFLKDPRFERIRDVLPIKIELAGKKIK